MRVKGLIIDGGWKRKILSRLQTGVNERPSWRCLEIYALVGWEELGTKITSKRLSGSPWGYALCISFFSGSGGFMVAVDAATKSLQSAQTLGEETEVSWLWEMPMREVLGRFFSYHLFSA